MSTKVETVKIRTSDIYSELVKLTAQINNLNEEDDNIVKSINSKIKAIVGALNMTYRDSQDCLIDRSAPSVIEMQKKQAELVFGDNIRNREYNLSKREELIKKVIDAEAKKQKISN